MPDTVQFINTLSGKKEVFKPQVAGKVHLYSCGPTVYDYAHIGNFRSFLMADLLTRVLTYAGYEVTKVMNITDVGHLTNDDLADADGDDKVAKKAKAEGKTAWDVAKYFTDAFVEDEQVLRIQAPNHRPCATDYIPQQIKMAQDLIAEGYAYEVNGSVYFRTAKFKDYGCLSKNNLADLQAGARVEVNDEKEDPLDFALWKHAEPEHLMQWESPWGQGYPGWHIECSAMSAEILKHVDIHTGGEDNIFPHHECEIAQNKCGHGPDIPYWLHGKHLLVDGTKMSKSKGNFYTIRDLTAKGWSGEEIRYALMSAHYRSALNFTESSLQQARNSIARLQEAHRLFSDVTGLPSAHSGRDKVAAARQQFKTALFDDMNVSDALATVFDAVSDGLKAREAGTLTNEHATALVTFLEEDFNRIFDVLDLGETQIPSEVEILLQQRQKARTNKDFTESDRLRDEIKNLGWEVKDEAGGQSVNPL